jgi:hypothetical protein
MAPVTDGRRRQRRHDRSAQLAVVALAVVIGVGAAVAGSPRGATAARTEPEGRARGAARENVLPAGSLLFGHVAPDGRLDLLVGFGWDRGARTGTALLIPSTTLVEVPSLGPQALADVPRLAAPKLLQVVVENALGIDFDGQALVGDDKLAALLAPAGRIRVDFPTSTRVDDSAGTIAFRAGVQEIAAADAMRLLAARARDELAHLVVVGAVLEGWRAALAREGVGSATVQADQRLLPLTITAGADMRTSTLPVERLSSGGERRFRLRVDDATDLVTGAFPWAVISKGERPRVEVLNGVGGVGVTQTVAAKLVPAGGQVTLTGNVPGFGVATTQVVYYRPEARADARRLAKALGVGKVVRAGDAIDVVDVTVVVGEDFQRSSR